MDYAQSQNKQMQVTEHAITLHTIYNTSDFPKTIDNSKHSLWNKLHKDMVQYQLMKCLKGNLKKYYICVMYLYMILLCCDIVKYHSEPIW